LAQVVDHVLDHTDLGGQHQGLLSLLKRGPYYGRHRVGLLTRGRPPQKSAAAFNGSSGGPGKRLEITGCVVAVRGLGRRDLREADEPHGPPAHEAPKYATAGADLGEQGRGRARASPLFQEIK
jgi:hypothetical protein